MKTLVIVSHPTISESSSQQFLLAGIKEDKQVTVRHLESLYPEGKLDVKTELALLEAHQRIIFQFPLYWYSSPALLKSWQDQVLSVKEMYSATGSLLSGKEFGIVLTIGVHQSAYCAGGREGVTIDELMRPFQAIARHMKMSYLPSFNVHQFGYLTEIEKKTLLIRYRYYLTGTNSQKLTDRTDWLLAELENMQAVEKNSNQGANLSHIMTQIRENQEALLMLSETLDSY